MSNGLEGVLAKAGTVEIDQSAEVWAVRALSSLTVIVQMLNNGSLVPLSASTEEIVDPLETILAMAPPDVVLRGALMRIKAEEIARDLD
jgi:hypothetical protein